ncbi:MAG TPA: hypothetical protein VNI54_12475, partial [Thermoanaerobaculia bacterium]|nr:hypothetical protein [Thermoanaerobaculia bacterium]
MKFSFAQATLVLVFAVGVFAQDHPNGARGFKAESVYQTSDVDNVNLFNGNLLVTVPLGQTYHVGGNLSYSLNLVYNGQMWSYRKFLRFATAVPGSQSNVALGWQLTLGELTAPATVPRAGDNVTQYDIGEPGPWTFTSPDGASHPFIGGIHPEESRATTAPATRQVPVLGYTTDNTYMRLHGGDWELIDDQVDLKKWAVRVTVQMPTGLSYRFRSQNTIASNERPVYAPGAPTVITSRYFLESISDAFGNRVEIRYYSSPNVRDDIRPHLATIREIAEFPAGYPNSGSPQRTHRIYLENVQWFRPNIEADNHTLTRFVVKRVELQTWLGPKTYEFDTEPAAVVALPCESEHEPTKQPPDVDFQAKAHLLRAVKLPDGTSYSFTYQQPDPSLWATGGPCNPFAGHMLSLTQPTGARIDYTVGVRQFPQVLPDDNGAPAGTAFQKFFRDYHSPWYTSLAVKTRTVTSGDDLTKWTYATCKGAPMQHPNERRWQEMTVKVDGPDGRTQHYFSVDLSTDTDYPGRLSEYGLPFTRGHPFPLDPSYFLSTEILDGSCDALQTSQFCAPCDDKVVQRTYVKYELDDHIDFPLTTATETGTDFHLNSRRVGTITVRRRFDESSRKWVDDKSCGEAGNQLCFTKVEQGEYDGLGHYRTETRFTSDIPDNGNAVKSDGLTRVTRTNYDAVQVSGHTPAVYKSDPAFTNDPGRYMVPPTQERWQLDFYDKTTVQETLDGLAGTEITTARVCLDPGTGVLTRKKTIRANDTNLDAVAAFGHDAQGNLQKESYHLVPKEDPGQEGSAWCSAPLPDAEVSMSHVWSHGSLSESSYDNPFVRTLKLDIHRPTGLPERSYDAMGRATEYAYDAMGRITLVKPPSVGDAVQASSVYEYDVPGLRATVRQVDGATVLTETHHYYDALGRLIQSRRRTPDGWVTTAKKYDPMGRVATLTVPVFTDSPAFSRTFVARGASSPPPVTTFTYDRLGRAKTVLAPDNSVVRTDYVESDVRRTVRVATRHDSPSTQAAQTDVTTIETYDGFGRLVSVQEPPLRAGDPVGPVTRYLYDFGDRLTRVIAGEQERIFTYDRAGLLEEEDHPETALTKYTYDARGHALTKNIGSGVKLVYTYDGAERLTRISDGLRGKSLKDFHYDRFEQTEEKGRLIAQSRHNHFSPGQASVVTDRFTFDGVGRVKTRKTSVSHGSAPADEFVQTFDYTPLGAPSKINYPTCTTCGPNGQNARGIPLTFKDGLLTNIGGITAENAGAGSNGIAYSASGSVFKVQHGLSDGRPGVLDTFTPDALGMARLESIEFTGAIDCALITAEPADTTVDREGRAALQLRAVEGAQIQWYRGPQGTTSAPLASTDGRLLTDPLLETTEFWALVSIPGGTCKQSTRTITVKVCVPASALPQKVSHKILINAPLPLTVTADGTNLRYEWSSRLAPAGEWTLFGTQRQVEFKQGSPGRYDVIVVLTAPGCGLPLTVEIAQVDVKAPTPCDAEFRTVLDPKVTVSMPNGRRRLVAELELREGATYRFDWYEDGVFQHSDTAGNVSTYDMVIREKDKIVRVEATTTCGTETSPKVISESYGTVHGRCTAPVVEVDPPSLVFSNETVLQIGATSNRTDVTYQWYLGESGNTDMKVAEGTSPTVFVPARPETYWVRVTVAKCGAFTDSPAIPVASNRCAPVRLLRQPPDREIRAGDSTDLFVDATALPLPLGHRWYLYGERGVHQEIQGTEAGNATFRVTPLRTTDYLAVVTNGAHRLHDAACYDEASTRRARVHVTSCADINVTSQPQDRSEYPGTAVTLRIDATAVMPLRYQWYGGKSGDTQNPIAGATGPTLNATDTGDYWVRVGFDDWNLCAIDSRTAGVVFCTTPTVSGGTRKSTVAGQTHVLVADYQADRPTFAWYADVLDDESRRLPSTTEVAEVAPLATTTYYVRVSNACDALDPASAFATFKVSVCPTVIVHPFAAKTLVVRNTKTSVSLNVNGADKIEWFVHLDGADGDGTVFATGTLQTVETPPITGKTHVWARVHNGECWLDTTAVIIDVCSGPTVTWGTNPDKVTQDSRHNITAVADPATAAVDFYEGPAGDLAASVVVYSGNVYPATFHTTRKLWFRATQQGCYADSTQLTVEVCVPEIKAQPQSVMIDKTANPNATATLTVLATPSTGMLPTYQWYVGQPGVTTTPIVGQTSASLTVSPTSETAYWVRVTGCGISRDSVAATVSLCAKPEIRTQPPSRTLVSGSSTVLSVDAVGTDLTYQWYRGASGDVSSPVNSTSASLTVEPTVTTDYWVKVSGRCGTVSSATAKISVKPTITLQPAGGSVMPGSSKTL